MMQLRLRSKESMVCILIDCPFAVSDLAKIEIFYEKSLGLKFIRIFVFLILIMRR